LRVPVSLIKGRLDRSTANSNPTILVKHRPASLPPLQEAVTDALEGVNLLHEAIRDAQKRLSVSHEIAQHENESRVAKAIFPIMAQLQAARGSSTFARMRLRGIARNIGAREKRRSRTSRKA
jgi:hypothetical protein